MSIETPTATVVVDDQANDRSAFAVPRRFLRNVFPNYKRFTTLADGMKGIRRIARQGKHRQAVVFLDQRFGRGRTKDLGRFTHGLRQMETTYDLPIIVFIFTNFPGDYSPQEIQADELISKLDLPSKQTELHDTVIRVIRARLSKYAADRFACGAYVYRLKKSLCDEDAKILTRDILGQSERTQQNIECALHYQFQRLLHITAAERTKSERNLWTLLLRYIDYPKYQIDNPRLLTRTGVLIGVDYATVRIQWYGSNRVEKFSFRTFPADVAVATPGDTITVQYRLYRNNRRHWHDCTVQPPLRENARVLAEDGSRILTLDSVLPIGTWPKTTTI